jgi:archaellum component FlaC
MADQVPNPAVMSQAMATMSLECAKFDNMPTFNQGAAILQTLGQINNRLVQMDQRIGGIDQRIGGIDQRIGGIDHHIGQIDRHIGQMELQINDRFNILETKILAM